MGGLSVPRAERSGSHRIVEVDVGDVRQTIAALAGVATLSRSPSVGARALLDVVHDLRAACVTLPSAVTAALLPACEVIALSTDLPQLSQTTLASVVAVAREAVDDVVAAIDDIERRGSSRPSPSDGGGSAPTAQLRARARLRLQASCDRAVDVLAHVRVGIELLQRASTGEPVAVSLEELFRELDVDGYGDPVEIVLCGHAPPAVVVQPRVGIGVLRGMLATVHARHPGASLAARAEVLLEEGRVRVEVSVGGPQEHGCRRIRVGLPPPMPYDEGLLTLAAATLAAPLEVCAGGHRVRLDLLSA